jgi:hypothetical protein
MQAVRYNYLKLIPRLLGELAKTNRYSVDGLDRLSKAVSASIIRNYEWMTPSDKAFMVSELKNSIDNGESPVIKSNLQECFELLSR